MRRSLSLPLVVLLVAGCSGPEPEPACPEGVDLDPVALPEDLDHALLLCDGQSEEPFVPVESLFTDGLDKERAVILPPGATLVMTDATHWELPVGTRLLKRIRQDGRVLETRIAWHTSEGWQYRAYTADERGVARRSDEGAHNVLGTSHDVPHPETCKMCHGQDPQPIGFSPWALAHTGSGVTVRALDERGLIDGAVEHRLLLLAAPGGRAAAYLAINCGSCHRDGGEAEHSAMRLDLGSELPKTLEATPLFRTAVDVAVPYPWAGQAERYIAPGVPEESFLWQRMHTTDPGLKMPPYGRDTIDERGVELVAEMIRSLAPAHP